MPRLATARFDDNLLPPPLAAAAAGGVASLRHHIAESAKGTRRGGGGSARLHVVCVEASSGANLHAMARAALDPGPLETPPRLCAFTARLSLPASEASAAEGGDAPKRASADAASAGTSSCESEEAVAERAAAGLGSLPEAVEAHVWVRSAGGSDAAPPPLGDRFLSCLDPDSSVLVVGARLTAARPIAAAEGVLGAVSGARSVLLLLSHADEALAAGVGLADPEGLRARLAARHPHLSLLRVVVLPSGGGAATGWDKARALFAAPGSDLLRRELEAEARSLAAAAPPESNLAAAILAALADDAVERAPLWRWAEFLELATAEWGLAEWDGDTLAREVRSLERRGAVVCMPPRSLGPPAFVCSDAGWLFRTLGSVSQLAAAQGGLVSEAALRSLPGGRGFAAEAGWAAGVCLPLLLSGCASGEGEGSREGEGGGEGSGADAGGEDGEGDQSCGGDEEEASGVDGWAFPALIASPSPPPPHVSTASRQGWSSAAVWMTRREWAPAADSAVASASVSSRRARPADSTPVAFEVRVEMSGGGGAYAIGRAYRDFKALHAALSKSCPSAVRGARPPWPRPSRPPWPRPSSLRRGQVPGLFPRLRAASYPHRLLRGAPRRPLSARGADLLLWPLARPLGERRGHREARGTEMRTILPGIPSAASQPLPPRSSRRSSREAHTPITPLKAHGWLDRLPLCAAAHLRRGGARAARLPRRTRSRIAAASLSAAGALPCRRVPAAADAAVGGRGEMSREWPR